ncbi:uncharacterized protein LOC106664418 [Cimex lectularius]|uniref:Uncharacterized protein n=1 Tax=Cimex lectularius TaxID=79782 RepID=A0A8I6RKI1_CIMLE|nr:uncharacterized protein LOC106664418 [Cimex lectularius]
MWLLLVLATFASATPALGDSFISDVGKALKRISSSKNPYSLVPGIRFDPRPKGRSRQRRHFTILDSAEEVFTNHDLVWEVAPGLEIRIYEADDGRFLINAGPSKKNDGASRTFGVMRRMKMALLPIMFKLGVITTLLMMLTVFALKGLTIGVILLIFTTAGFLSKFKVAHQDPWGFQKDVHLHVHGGQHSPHYEHPWDRDGYMNYNYNRPIPEQSHRSPWDPYIS